MQQWLCRDSRATDKADWKAIFYKDRKQDRLDWQSAGPIRKMEMWRTVEVFASGRTASTMTRLVSDFQRIPVDCGSRQDGEAN